MTPDTKTVTFESGTPIEIGKVATDLSQPESADASPPSSDEQFQEQVLGLLQKMSGAIAGLSQRVEAVESSGPRFVKMTPETYGNEPDAHERYQLAEMVEPDKLPRSQTIPVTSDGLRIPEIMLDENPFRYGSGMKVRLNLDAIPHGRSDGKTRGQLMAEFGTPNGVGEVIDRTFLSRQRRADGRRGVWKYRIRFPQEVMPGSNGGIVSLHEPELIPA